MSSVRSGLRRLAATAAFAGVLGTAAACSASSTCDCADPSVLVHVPASLAQPGDTLALSGSACQGVTAACAQQSGGACLTYSLRPKASGNCHVDVSLQSHVFSADVIIKTTGGCCPGLYADPLAAGDVQVASFR